MKGLFLLYLCLVFVFAFSANAFAQQDSVNTNEPSSVGIDSVKRNRLLLYPGFGVSLVRNDIAPVFYISLGLNHADRYEVNLNTASFFFFERDIDKNYNVYRNTFLNLEFLLNFSILNKKEKDFNGIGVGYLVESKGQYFREATVMAYYKRKFRYFSIMPGFILADELKDIFPVISIRL